jgi:hypothetical protein
MSRIMARPPNPVRLGLQDLHLEEDMPITGTPSAGNDLITITPSGLFGRCPGWHRHPETELFQQHRRCPALYYSGGYYRYTDDFLTTVDYLNFERFDLTMGSGDDMLVGGALNDRLVGGGGNDWFSGGLGADTMIGGAGSDRWEADYSTVGHRCRPDPLAVGTATIAATGANLNGIEAHHPDHRRRGRHHQHRSLRRR